MSGIHYFFKQTIVNHLNACRIKCIANPAIQNKAKESHMEFCTGDSTKKKDTLEFLRNSSVGEVNALFNVMQFDDKVYSPSLRKALNDSLERKQDARREKSLDKK